MTHGRPRAAGDPAVLSGLRWTGVTAFAVRLSGLVRGLVLARLVGPRAFGIVAGVTAFTGVAALVAELGLGSYLVHRGRKARADAGPATRAAMMGGAAGTLVVVVASVPIAALYDDRQAGVVALALAPTVLSSVITLVLSGLLRAELRFRALAASEMLGGLGGLVAGIAVAVAGGSVWAVVASILAAQAVALLVVWRLARLGWPRRVDGGGAVVRRALRFGWKVAAGGLLWAVALQGDNVVVGRALGPVALGLYALAYTYGTLPGTTIGAIVGQVAFPVFARLPAHLVADAFVRFTRLTASVSLPLAGLGVALAQPAVHLLLGPRWAGTVRPLQWLVVAGAIRGLFPTDELFRAAGRPDVELRIGFVAAPTVVTAAIVGSHSGIAAVAAAVAAVFVVAALVALVLSTSICAISLGRVLRAVVPALALSIVAGTLTFLVVQLVEKPLPSLLAGGGAGLACVVVGLRFGLGADFVALRELLWGPGERADAGATW